MTNPPLAIRRSSVRPAAFTLLEILLVVALAGILAALLFPALGKMKSSGNRLKCLANLRQIGTAFSQYAADHDGWVVKARDYSGWVEARTADGRSPGCRT